MLEKTGKADHVSFNDAHGLHAPLAKMLRGWALPGADKAQEGFVAERKFHRDKATERSFALVVLTVEGDLCGL